MSISNEDGSITEIKMAKIDGSTIVFDTEAMMKSIVALTQPTLNHRQYSTAALQSALFTATSAQFGGYGYSGTGKSVSMSSSFGDPFENSNYSIDRQYPFKLHRKEDDDFYGDCMFFERRMDAEKLILKKKIKYFKRKLKESTENYSNYHKRKKLFTGYNGDKEFAKKYRIVVSQLQQELLKIEEEHPEWLI